MADRGRPSLGWLDVTRRAGRWNHNIHYYLLVLAVVPPGCQRVLDVGCGEGMLARQLADLVPHVSGVDADARSIDLARSQDPAGRIDLMLYSAAQDALLQAMRRRQPAGFTSPP